MENIPGNLDRFFEAVKTLRMRGFIVTMPYKTQMLPYMDVVSGESRAFNCIDAVKYADSRLYEAAFDVYGMCQTIEDVGVKLAER